MPKWIARAGIATVLMLGSVGCGDDETARSADETTTTIEAGETETTTTTSVPSGESETDPPAGGAEPSGLDSAAFIQQFTEQASLGSLGERALTAEFLAATASFAECLAIAPGVDDEVRAAIAAGASRGGFFGTLEQASPEAAACGDAFQQALIGTG